MNDIIKKGNLLLDLLIAHYKAIGLALGGVMAFGLGLAGFFQYQNYQLEKGYEYVATIQKYVESEIGSKRRVSDLEAIQFNDLEEKWTTIEQESIKAQTHYGNTKLGGVFLAYQARAALELGKKDQAITLFSAASSKTSDKALAAQYSLSVALLQLDSEATKVEALKTLQTLAEQKNLPVHALALYYLGEYSWVQKNYTDAQNYWSQLVIASQTDKSLVDLELVNKANDKLKLMKVS